MAQSSPSRRALVDLPVNTLGTPSSMTTVGKASMGHKRQIQEVEEPEYAQSTSRVRVSPARSQSILKDDAPLGQVSHAFPELEAVRLNFVPDSASTIGSSVCLFICPSYTSRQYDGRASRRDGRG